MSEKHLPALQQYSKLVKDEVKMIEQGAKLSTLKRQEKPRQKQLKKQLTEALIRDIARTGDVNVNLWPDIKNLFIMVIKDVLEQYHETYKDSKTFDEEKEVILQYFVFFERPPFTIQRIAELTLAPQRHYQSCKKILYAYEKLVNVCDPDER